jgi:hypothetical protein
MALARVTSGHATSAPLMHSRRFIRSPRQRGAIWKRLGGSIRRRARPDSPRSEERAHERSRCGEIGRRVQKIREPPARVFVSFSRGTNGTSAIWQFAPKATRLSSRVAFRVSESHGRASFLAIKAAEFRKNAADCRQMAERARNPFDREHWLDVTAHWTKMALAEEVAGCDGWMNEKSSGPSPRFRLHKV